MGLAKSAEIIRETIKKVSKEILPPDFGSGARAWPWSVDLGLELRLGLDVGLELGPAPIQMLAPKFNVGPGHHKMTPLEFRTVIKIRASRIKLHFKRESKGKLH